MHSTTSGRSLAAQQQQQTSGQSTWIEYMLTGTNCPHLHEAFLDRIPSIWIPFLASEAEPLFVCSSNACYSSYNILHLL